MSFTHRESVNWAFLYDMLITPMLWSSTFIIQIVFNEKGRWGRDIWTYNQFAIKKNCTAGKITCQDGSQEMIKTNIFVIFLREYPLKHFLQLSMYKQQLCLWYFLDFIFVLMGEAYSFPFLDPTHMHTCNLPCCFGLGFYIIVSTS